MRTHADPPDLESPPDSQLVLEARAGGLAAFEALVRRHARRVQRVVRTVLRNDRDVEDVAQQAFLHAFVGLAGFEGSASFSTWITRIALNEAILRLRRARRAARYEGSELEPLLPSAAPGPEETAAARETLAQLRRAVRRLPPHQREVFRLRHVEGLSITETAARLGISETAVKLRVHRSRITLRRALGRERFLSGHPPSSAGATPTEALQDCEA
jgi:RNA polymerase sigma-70 factor (ECF subfamily)